MTDRAQEVLEFWFGTPQAGESDPQSRIKLWFTKSPETDETIRSRFGKLLETACHGGLTEWEDKAESRLALVLVLDQFSRNVYRDTPAAFSQDGRALKLALEAMENGMLEAVSPIQRMFYLMPLEHAEDLAIQERCVAAFQALAEAADGNDKEMFRNFSGYAVAHRDVIAQFGRFPHRNAILGRVSTEAEKAYLAKPGSGF